MAFDQEGAPQFFVFKKMKQIILLWIQFSIATAFSLLGCYTTYTNTNPDFILTSNTLTVEQCSTVCLEQNLNRSILQLDSCACLSTTEFNDRFYQVNIVECTATCSDTLPCGEQIFTRFSAYDNTVSSASSTLSADTSIESNTSVIVYMMIHLLIEFSHYLLLQELHHLDRPTSVQALENH